MQELYRLTAELRANLEIARRDDETRVGYLWWAVSEIREILDAELERRKRLWRWQHPISTVAP